MKQVLIIPNKDNMARYLELANRYNVGFEYNEFYDSRILDDEEKAAAVIEAYKKEKLPAYTTIHGAFLDVIPFSTDKKIREVANLRVNQSIDMARRIGAKAVVFHTNYNPFLNSLNYMESWVMNNLTYWSGILRENPDMNIYLENMFEQSPDILEELSEGLCRYDNYGVCLDYAHAYLSELNPRGWAKRLSPYIKHIHINDTDGSRDLHWAWGDGVIARDRFYEDFERFMPNATVLVETKTLENTEKSLELLRAEKFI